MCYAGFDSFWRWVCVSFDFGVYGVEFLSLCFRVADMAMLALILFGGGLLKF